LLFGNLDRAIELRLPAVKYPDHGFLPVDCFEAIFDFSDNVRSLCFQRIENFIGIAEEVRLLCHRRFPGLC